MFYRTVFPLTGIMVVCFVLVGCGSDVFQGRLISIEGNRYTIRQSDGKDGRVWVDERTKKDHVKPGDDVRITATKDGHATNIQKMD